MRRLAAIAAVLATAAGLWTLTTAASDDASEKPTYVIELDNAFGLIEGADMKVAGVRAGKITGLEIDRKTKRALVEVRIDETGFGSLRADVRCDSRPQSLIGEYFVDCLPGTAAKELESGSRIPVEKTSSTVAPDLVNNILRRPQRERLRILISELGAGVAGNGENLNAALRRAVPALTETDKVLAKLAEENRTLADLAKNADVVLEDLAGNRKDVGRWVEEARDTAVASAERRDDIARGFNRLPVFLEELEPTMERLGVVADEQGTALTQLRASASNLTRFFGNLGPFADASRPAIRSLGEASKTGRSAVEAATPTVDLLDKYARGVPELGKNLAIILEHLDDPGNAVEYDQRAAASTGRPMPTGYSGLEALLTYVYDQLMTTNIYDQNAHILSISPFEGGECADYADVEAAKSDGGSRLRDCTAELGPNQPGINFPDESNPKDPTYNDTVSNPKNYETQPRPAPGPTTRRESAAVIGPDGKRRDRDRDSDPLALPKLPDILPGLDGVKISPTGPPPIRQTDPATEGRLLDYLLG